MVKVFFSYSHQDETNRNELEKHLAVLKRERLIETWHDRRILAGASLGSEIDQNLVEANLLLLLVSPDFLASDYCYSMEMRKALEMRGQGIAWVIPIILDHCDWRSTPLRDLLACPKDGTPIADYPNPNKAFSEVTHEIRRVIQEITSTQMANGKSSAQSRQDVSAHECKPTVVDKARSGNLRIKREFSDYDRDTFKKNTFDYMAKFFNNSLEELKTRNYDIRFTFEREGIRLSATVYRSGKEIARCTVVNRGRGNSWQGITYSHGRDENSINSSLNVEDDGYSLFLIPMVNMSGEKERLSEKGAAELYWSMFIEQLQH